MKKNLIKEAAEAHTNLNLFAAIQALLENGLVYGGENAAAAKIIAICRKEQNRQLAIYDAASAVLQQGKTQ
jgi:hypothetical protein